ncbi:iron donor protein CyaY [Buchnera aphidicola]|uniref:iron donor protein CyaY n=1 Tax=Buchnera aphidicola TaxID=9 RepID=UPI0031B80039
MNNTKFITLYNQILCHIEDYLDKFDHKTEMDYEIVHHMMTISFSLNNKIIVSKQETLKQIWLATKNNGYHFNYQNNNWICSKTKKNFWRILEEAFYIQGNEKVDFSKFITIVK